MRLDCMQIIITRLLSPTRGDPVLCAQTFQGRSASSMASFCNSFWSLLLLEVLTI